MVKHSDGKTLGNTHRHSVMYQRLNEFIEADFIEESQYTNKIDNLLPLNETHRVHYTSIYKLRNKEVKNFFEKFGKDRIVVVSLEDQEKWKKIGAFFNIQVADNYEVHANKSN
jgi:hypothetical protein